MNMMLQKQHKLLLCHTKIADMHFSRLRAAVSNVEPLLPLTPDKLNDDSVAMYIDSMVARFAQLFNVLSYKIFPLMLELFLEDRVEDSFIDRLNRLEKVLYLDDTNWWLDLKSIRDTLARDDSMDLEATSTQLNKCASASKELLDYWTRLRAKMQSAHLI